MKLFHKAFKALLLASICLLSMWTHAQPPVKPSTLPSPKSPPAYYEIGTVRLDSFGVQFVPRQGDYQPVTGLSGIRYYRDSLFYWRVDSSDWAPVSQGKGNIIAAGPFTTSNIGIGFNPCTNCTATDIINSVWYGEQPPTITLTGGTTLKYTGASTVSQTVSLNACRGSNTTNLVRITVHGSDGTDYPVSFSNPAQSGCTGTINQVVTIPANINITFTDTVTTQSGKQATATTSFPFAPQRGYGWISDTTNIGVSGNQDATINGLTQQLSTSKAFSFNPGAATNKFLVIYYTQSSGQLSSLTIGGIGSLGSFNKTTRTLVYDNGYVDTIWIYWNTQAQTTSGVGYNVVTQ